MSITKTYSYIMTYKFIEPVIKSYYSKPIVIKEKGKYDKEVNPKSCSKLYVRLK